MVHSKVVNLPGDKDWLYVLVDHLHHHVVPSIYVLDLDRILAKCKFHGFL